MLTKSCEITKSKWSFNTQAVFSQHSWSFVCKTNTEKFLSWRLFRQFWKIQRTVSLIWLLKKSFNGAIDITPSDYQNALISYQKIGCRNLGDYHDICLKTDVILLADIFEKNSETYARKCSRSIGLTSTQLPLWVGNQCSFRLKWNRECCCTLICCCFLNAVSGAE